MPLARRPGVSELKYDMWHFLDRGKRQELRRIVHEDSSVILENVERSILQLNVEDFAAFMSLLNRSSNIQLHNYIKVCNVVQPRQSMPNVSHVIPWAGLDSRLWLEGVAESIWNTTQIQFAVDNTHLASLQPMEIGTIDANTQKAEDFVRNPGLRQRVHNLPPEVYRMIADSLAHYFFDENGKKQHHNVLDLMRCYASSRNLSAFGHGQ